MKNFFALSLISVLSASLLNAEIARSGDRHGIAEKAGKEAVSLLKTTLMKNLKESMKKNGPAATVKFCSEKALVLTDDVSKMKKGIKVKRVSQKYRNDFNKPDKIDGVAFEYFTQLKEKNGEYPESFMTRLRHKNNKDIDIFRYYEPLVIEKPCLTCHGESIDGGVKKVLKKLYPKDKATGYKLGELRGLIAVEVTPNALELK